MFIISSRTGLFFKTRGDYFERHENVYTKPLISHLDPLNHSNRIRKESQQQMHSEKETVLDVKTEQEEIERNSEPWLSGGKFFACKLLILFN